MIASRHRSKQSVVDQTKLQETRNALGRRIKAWRGVQDVYMPYVATLLDDLDDDENPPDEDVIPAVESKEPLALAESLPLYLPSGLPSHLRNESCSVKLLRNEVLLRIAQCDDSLVDLRRLRRVLTGIGQFKWMHVSGTGQKANTRMRSLYDKFQQKISLTAARYRAAYNALLVIDPAGTWKHRLRELHDRDIRGPGKDEDDDALGEGRREPSWIWLVSGVPMGVLDKELATSPEFINSMRVEWAKTRARALRWDEETQLLQEEMRRVLAFFEWKAGWWRAQAHRREGPDDFLSGLEAYAERQAAMYDKLASRFALKWLKVLRVHGISPSWEAQYASLVNEMTTTRSMFGQGWRTLDIEMDSTLSDGALTDVEML